MRLSLKAKVLSLAVLPVLLFALVISLTTVWILQDQADKEVEETRQRLLNDAKATLQSYVEVAMSAIKPLYDAAQPGDEAARAQVIKLLSNITYGTDGYFFGYDSQTVRLFKGNRPRPEWRVHQPRVGTRGQGWQPLCPIQLIIAGERARTGTQAGLYRILAQMGHGDRYRC